MKRTTRWLLFLLACGVPTFASTDTQLDTLRQAALAGDANARYELGVLHEFGRGLKDPQVSALAWYLLAAEQGHPDAAARRDALQSRLAPPAVDAARRLAQEWRAPGAVPAPSP